MDYADEKFNFKYEIILIKKRGNIYELELRSPVNCLNDDENGTHYQLPPVNVPIEWKKLDNTKFKLELPRETILLAEKVVEYHGHVKF